jgi:hypothetical protein
LGHEFWIDWVDQPKCVIRRDLDGGAGGRWDVECGWDCSWDAEDCIEEEETCCWKECDRSCLERMGYPLQWIEEWVYIYLVILKRILGLLHDKRRILADDSSSAAGSFRVHTGIAALPDRSDIECVRR